MQKLLVAATEFEIEEYLTYYSFNKISDSIYKKENTHILISGIGLTETTFQLTKFLCNQDIDFVLQAGVAGAYSEELKLGQLVEVVTEQYGDLGAEDNSRFLTLPEMSLKFPDQVKDGILSNTAFFPDLPQVKDITVNTVGGSEKTISLRREIFNADTETMEGFALFRLCKALKINHSQVRSISNRVEVRNKANWKIQLAITNLNQFLIQNFNPK